LGKKCQRAFHCFVASAGPMFFKHGIIAKMGSGVKVQINHFLVIQAKAFRLLDEGLLELHDVYRIQAVGIGGHGRAFGQHIEPGKQTRPRIKGVFPHMGVPVCTDKLERKKRQEVIDRRNLLCTRQAGLVDNFADIELLDKRGKKKNTGRLGFKLLGRRGWTLIMQAVSGTSVPLTVKPVLSLVLLGSFEYPASARTRSTVRTEISIPSSDKS